MKSSIIKENLSILLMNPLEIPHLTRYVNDFSHIFSEDQKNPLDAIFSEHEKKTTEQVVTVFIPHREGNELLDIGLKLFNENGIGQKNLNNGLLLIVSTEEKKLRIIVGKGLELKYTEMVCRDIVENHLRPLLNAGKYEEMVKIFYKKISFPLKSNVIFSFRRQEENIGNNITNVVDNFFRGFFIILIFTVPLLISSKLSLTITSVFNQIFGSEFGFGIGLATISLFTLYVSIIFLFIKKEKLIRIILLIFFITGVIGSTIFYIYPINCQSNFENQINTVSCNRNVGGYVFRTENITYISSSSYSSSSTSTSRSSSDYSSSDSSSSFDGGGGSSNGGGYGD